MKFFRKIRQRLITENKFSKYLIYAIGEITLVVIGILIALQVNNLNELRKKREAEYQVLNSLLADLISNEEKLKKVEPKINRQINETKLILDFMADEPIDSLFNKAKKYIYESSEVEDVQLNLSGIQGLINNKIELIMNDSIKRAIIHYPVAFENYKEQENLMKDLKHSRIRPKIKEYMFLENLTSGSSKFPSDIRGMLSDRTLANDFIDRLWESNEWKTDFLILRKNGRDLIELIEKELKENK